MRGKGTIVECPKLDPMNERKGKEFSLVDGIIYRTAYERFSSAHDACASRKHSTASAMLHMSNDLIFIVSPSLVNRAFAQLQKLLLRYNARISKRYQLFYSVNEI